MLYTLLIIAVILFMLALERITVTRLTRKPVWKCRIRNSVFFTPNGISCLRIPQGFIAIMFACYGHWTAAILWFAFWMITDLSDGTIARNCNLETPTGKWLDPLSDKFMAFPALFYLSLGKDVVSPRLTLWMVIVYCLIDTLGQCSRLFCKKTAANSFGKAKTALVTVLIAILALNQLRIPELSYLNQRMTDAVMLACVILSFFSFYCKIVPSHWYANTLTFLNFSCGLSALFYLWGPFFKDELQTNKAPRYFVTSFILIFVGQFFDLFDGKMARKYGSTEKGALFDDIADGTSFGLAIGSMVFLGFSACVSPAMPYWLSAIFALTYTSCIIWRLYRFIHPTIQLPQGIFQGLPSPAGALLAGSITLLCIQFSGSACNPLAIFCVILASGMMISNIPYRHFGQNLWPSTPKFFRMLLLITVIVLACFGWAKSGWGTAFSATTTFLAIAYIIFAIAPRKLLEKLQLEEKGHDSQQIHS